MEATTDKKQIEKRRNWNLAKSLRPQVNNHKVVENMSKSLADAVKKTPFSIWERSCHRKKRDD